ncbi:YbhB/YbcL family Raf kinase inhibitor-like protein [Aspergillus fischeri NRRL 181]|uniref:PEBP-like protein n=1 Tax=Neosartorya fischeri (strain ATCC 1020 / DSM 3700 / CBS 544.65 / FGSC A1164 / JCM 1740 / NRRL 181 / WB 181) TaxID=331117 RepID=A1DJQ9_NEOFI|nr:conserved hypothetical protein [Aspergillus fischeri NRRL 181]EAW16948.1 conserved hypothetical protein [Aspergillus fischeri NRRL 181]
MEWIERPLSWLLANRKGHDAGLIQHTPPFAEHPKPSVTVGCPDIGPSGSQIPVKYSFFGEDLFPTLKWFAPPVIADNIKEWLLVVEDPDAPLAEPVVHGLYYGIPASKCSVSNEDFKPTAAGSHVLRGGFKYGANRRGTIYIPPRGMLGHGPHRYFFQVIGLLEPLVVSKLGAVVTKAEIILQRSATIPPNPLVLALRPTTDAGPEPGLQNGAARSLCGSSLNTSFGSGLQNFWFHKI